MSKINNISKMSKNLFDKDIYSLLEKQDCFGVACSGGADSIFLLNLTKAIFPNKKIVCLHYNHNTRKEQNDKEQAYVENFSNKIGVEFICEKSPLQNENASEDFLRNLRLDFFRKTNLQYILQAHHAGDALESHIMRLCKASSLSGIISPRKISKMQGFTILRPLLNLSPLFFKKYLKEEDILWFEDPSNKDEKYLRNNIRKNITPILFDIFGENLLNLTSKTHCLLLEDEQILENYLEKTCDFKNKKGLCLKNLLENEPMLLRRAILRFLNINFDNASFTNCFINKIISKICSNEKSIWQINKECFLIYENFILKKLDKKELDENSTYNYQNANLIISEKVQTFFPQGFSICAKYVNLQDDDFKDFKNSKIFPNCKFAFVQINQKINSLNIRFINKGDKYHILGASGQKKLSDIFITKKIKNRKNVPLISYNNDIIWAVNLPPNNNFKITNTKNLAIVLTYNKN